MTTDSREFMVNTRRTNFEEIWYVKKMLLVVQYQLKEEKEVKDRCQRHRGFKMNIKRFQERD